MVILKFEKTSRLKAQRWRTHEAVGYTGRNKKLGELLQAMPAPESQSDESVPAGLVHRIRSGDLQAEQELVNTYQRSILEILRHRTRDAELAQDLLQETFIVIIRRLRSEGIEQPEKLNAFIHRVAHNLVIAHFRKEARQNTQPDTAIVEMTSDSRVSELESILRQEQSQFIGKLLEELTMKRDREILLRFYVWNQEKPLVCDAMDLSTDQFDKVVSRARQRFRAIVLERLGDKL